MLNRVVSYTPQVIHYPLDNLLDPQMSNIFSGAWLRHYKILNMNHKVPIVPKLDMVVCYTIFHNCTLHGILQENQTSNLFSITGQPHHMTWSIPDVDSNVPMRERMLFGFLRNLFTIVSPSNWPGQKCNGLTMVCKFAQFFPGIKHPKPSKVLVYFAQIFQQLYFFLAHLFC